MSRTQRISVPIPPEIQRDLRVLCAQNGRSAAANLADLIAVGLQKKDLAERFDDLKTSMQVSSAGSANHAEILTQIKFVLAEFNAEFAEKLAVAQSVAQQKSGVLLPQEAAALLFEEALFSAQLSAEIVAAAMPGTPPKPPGQHIYAARQRAKAALAEVVKACQEEA